MIRLLPELYQVFPIRSASTLNGAALMVLAGLLVTLPASAIIIRHDTGYDAYFAREADFPAIFYLEARQRQRSCVATLIRPSWAITAAHCLSETSLGEHLEGQQPYSVEVSGQEARVIEAVVHRDYPRGTAPGRTEVDLALLRLDRALDLPRPMPLYRGGEEMGRVMTFVGWGFHALGSGGRFMNDGRFRQATNRVIHAGQRLRFRFDDPTVIDSGALPLEGFPGTGDSGGPALVQRQGRWRLAGVAVGELARDGEDGSELRQGLYGAVVLYERVSRHQDWIDRVTAADDGT
ncbi:MAG: trypsin-like serine protease [Pseudomonadota bacterium]